MSVFTTGIYNRLNNDATLTSLLADYSDDVPNAGHAIFTIEPIPGDAIYPYIIISKVSDTSDDTKQTRGRAITWDIRCYTLRTGSMVGVEAIAERVRTLLHRFSLVVTGYTTIVAEASGPFPAPVEDGVYGLIVTCSFRMEAD
jgi:hypothetical protein